MQAELLIVIGPQGLKVAEASAQVKCLFPTCSTAAEVRARLDADKSQAMIMANARLQNEQVAVDLGAAMRFHRAALMQADLLVRSQSLRSPSPYNSKEEVAHLQDTAAIGRTVMGTPTFGLMSSQTAEPISDRTRRAQSHARTKKGSAREKYDTFKTEYAWLLDTASASAVALNGVTRAAAAIAAVPVKHPVAIAVAAVGGFVIGAAEAATAAKITELTTDALINSIDG